MKYLLQAACIHLLNTKIFLQKTEHEEYFLIVFVAMKGKHSNWFHDQLPQLEKLPLEEKFVGMFLKISL